MILDAIDFNKIVLVPATEADREFGFQVKKTAVRTYVTELYGWDEMRQREFHNHGWEKARPDIIIYAGKPIGTVAVVRLENWIEIHTFFMLPAYHNRGIGTHILRNILKEADDTEKTIKLDYLRNNPAASLYKRHGFEIYRTDDYFCYTLRKPRPA